MNFFLEDILSQPKELKSALAFYNTEEFLNKLKDVSKLAFNQVIFSGMGSSHYCGIPANVNLARNGIISQVISTGELMHYELEKIKEGTLLCLISQSGESAEIVALLKKLPKNIKVIAVTNNTDSTLAKYGDFVFPLNVTNEKAVSTRTYLTSIIITLMLSYAIAKMDIASLIERLNDLVEKMNRYILNYKEVIKELDGFADNITSVNIMGRGYALTTAKGGALFFNEGARLCAASYDCAEFRHGPMEAVEEGFYSIILAPSGRSQDLSIKLAFDIAKKGGRVVLITDENADAEENANILKIVMPAVDEELASLLQIIPIQLLIDLIATKNGFVAGDFRWGSKVTVIE